MKLEFIIAGSATDAFWSQAAMFRRSLDNLGDDYRAARLVCCYAGRKSTKLPDRWKPYFGNIEIIQRETEERFENGIRCRTELVGDILNEEADVSFICDANTLLLRPFPGAFLDELSKSPALCGVISYYPPSLMHPGPTVVHEGTSPRQFWPQIAGYVLGRPIQLRNCHTLIRELEPCPFYIECGFMASTPKLLRQLHAQLRVVEPRILRIVNNECHEHISIALAVERANLPTRVLPIRFNFPTDRIADQFYPKELDKIILLHYLRTEFIDGHRIFNEPAEFAKFMASQLSGSSKIFQDYIRKITRGQFPFY